MSRPSNLSSAQIEAIRNSQDSLKVIASQFNISIPYVSMIRRGTRRVQLVK